MAERIRHGELVAGGIVAVEVLGIIAGIAVLVGQRLLGHAVQAIIHHRGGVAALICPAGGIARAVVGQRHGRVVVGVAIGVADLDELVSAVIAIARRMVVGV